MQKHKSYLMMESCFVASISHLSSDLIIKKILQWGRCFIALTSLALQLRLIHGEDTGGNCN